MSNVTPIKKDSHIAGEAKCLACQHEWVAVAPVGCIGLECPKCGTERGVYKYPCLPHKEEKIWKCNCGNFLFVVTPAGYFCPNCGEWASGF